MSPSLGSDPEARVLELIDQRARELLRGDALSTDVQPRSLRPDRLRPSGVAGSLLTDNGKEAAWQTPHCARMYFSGNQAIAENAWTKLTTGVTKHFETTAGMVDTANSQIVIPVAGLYRVTESCRWVVPGVNVQLAASRAYVAATATELTNTGAPALPGAAAALRPSGTATWPMNVGTRVELDAYWYAGVGGTFSTVGGAMAVFLEVHYLGPIPP